MDRYDIAKDPEGIEPVVIKYPVTPNVQRIMLYLQDCAYRAVCFDGRDFNKSFVQMACVALSQKHGVPLITGDVSEARAMKIAYAHDNVHYIGAVPKESRFGIFLDSAEKASPQFPDKPFRFVSIIW